MCTVKARQIIISNRLEFQALFNSIAWHESMHSAKCSGPRPWRHCTVTTQAHTSRSRYAFDLEFIFGHRVFRNLFLLPDFSQPQPFSSVAENEVIAHSLRCSVQGCVYKLCIFDLDSNLMKESSVLFMLRYILHSREKTEAKDHMGNKQ